MESGPRRPDPTPSSNPGPHQATAGLPGVGFHLLPVLLGFLDDVFMGHACGGRDQTRASVKELSEERGRGSAGCHPGPGPRSPTPQPGPAMERHGEQGKLSSSLGCLFSWKWRTCSKASQGAGGSMQPGVERCRRKVLGLWQGRGTPLPSCQGLPSSSAPLPQQGLRPDCCLEAPSPLFSGLHTWPSLAH